MRLRYSIPLAALCGFSLGVAGTFLLAVVELPYSHLTVADVAALAWRKRKEQTPSTALRSPIGRGTRLKSGSSARSSRAGGTS